MKLRVAIGILRNYHQTDSEVKGKAHTRTAREGPKWGVEV